MASITFRLSDEEKVELERLAEESRQKVGAYIKMVLFSDDPVGYTRPVGKAKDKVKVNKPVGRSAIEKPEFVAAQGAVTAKMRKAVDNLVSAERVLPEAIKTPAQAKRVAESFGWSGQSEALQRNNALRDGRKK